MLGNGVGAICMSDKVPYLIDTNVLIHAYDNLSNPAKHEKAGRLIEKCWLGKQDLAISYQNLAEFVYVITSSKVKHPVPVKTARQIVNDIIHFSSWVKIGYGQEEMLLALEEYEKQRKNFWDILIASTMIASDIFYIYTENIKDFKSYKKIKAQNPFE